MIILIMIIKIITMIILIMIIKMIIMMILIMIIKIITMITYYVYKIGVCFSQHRRMRMHIYTEHYLFNRLFNTKFLEM